MNKELIEQKIVEIAQDMDMHQWKDEHYAWQIEFASRFLAAVDAERGKEAPARLLKHIGNIKSLKGCVVARTYKELLSGTNSDAWEEVGKLFLAPQPAIPEGMALLPIEPTEKWIRSECLKQCETPFKSYTEWLDHHSTGISDRIRALLIEDYKAMIAAAKEQS